MFSDDKVAAAINDRFEPVWVSVREVPTVTIDFGEGHTIKRTLHGNVATQVLTADGTIVDILPGLYDADEYFAQLDQLWWLHHYLDRVADRTAFLADYHRSQARAIKESGASLTVRPFADVSKMSIEFNTKTLLRPPGSVALYKNPAINTKVEKPDFAKPGELAHWKKLYDDTKINETERRAQVHSLLAQMPHAKPEDVTKTVYREILHADIDDPYLGLGETLFKDYPFREDMPKDLQVAESNHR